MSSLELFPSLGSSAVFSACETCGRTDLCEDDHPRQVYRYMLSWKTSHADARHVLFILANPSTAIPKKPDPTVTRCINYGRDWGYGTVLVGNVRAWRETNPDWVPADPLAIGPYNDAILSLLIRLSDVVVCGWGKMGGPRGEEVLQLIRSCGKTPMALWRNQDGSPTHPLYQPKDSALFPL